jgi:hypothetical protein
VVRWNGKSEITTFVDPDTLQTVVSGADIGPNGGTAKVSVLNPGGAVSNQFSVPVLPAPGQLVIVNGPDPVDLGPIAVGSSGSPADVVLANYGPGTLTGLAATLTGGDFSMQNSCPKTMAPNTTCDIKLTFSPTAVGIRAGSISAISTNSGSGTFNFTGQGIPSGPALRTFPYITDFGQLLVGNSTQSSIAFYNVGTASVVFSGVSITGDFQIKQNFCTGSLAVGSYCFVYIAFSPTVSGTRTGTLSLASNVTGGPYLAPLTGVGVQPLIWSPASLDFGTALILSSTSKQITVHNPGTTISNLAGLSTGNNFSVSSTCGENVYPGQTCAVTVNFVPVQTGPISDSLFAVLGSGNFRSQLNLPLTGNGVDFQFLVATGGSNTATVKAGKTATYSLATTDQGYTGTAMLSCSNAPKLSTCTVSPSSVTLAGTASQPITVTVTTTAPTAASALAGPLALSFLTALIAVALIPLPRKALVKSAVATALCLMLLSCGGGSSSGGGGGGGGNPGTSPGTYPLTVSAVSGGVTHQLGLTLIVQ